MYMQGNHNPHLLLFKLQDNCPFDYNPNQDIRACEEIVEEGRVKRRLEVVDYIM